MTNKAYIGRGTKHHKYDLIDVVLDMGKVADHVYSFEGRQYLKFTVASRKEKDLFGATHSVYVRVRQAAETAATVAAEPAPETPAKGKRKRKA